MGFFFLLAVLVPCIFLEISSKSGKILVTKADSICRFCSHHLCVPILFWGSLSLFCLPVPFSSLDSSLISCVCLFKALAVGFATLLTHTCFPLCHLADHVLQLFGPSSLPSPLWLRYQSLMIRDLPFFGNICQILLYIIWGHIFLGADLGIIIYSWWIKTFININSQCMSLVIFYPQIYWSNIDIHQQRPFMRVCTSFHESFPGGACGKESVCQCRRCKSHEFDPWVGKIPWKRKWQPTPVFLPGGFHGQRSLVGYSPWGHRVGHDWARLYMTLSFKPVCFSCLDVIHRNTTQLFKNPACQPLTFNWRVTPMS